MVKRMCGRPGKQIHGSRLFVWFIYSFDENNIDMADKRQKQGQTYDTTSLGYEELTSVLYDSEEEQKYLTESETEEGRFKNHRKYFIKQEKGQSM